MYNIHINDYSNIDSIDIWTNFFTDVSNDCKYVNEFFKPDHLAKLVVDNVFTNTYMYGDRVINKKVFTTDEDFKRAERKMAKLYASSLGWRKIPKNNKIDPDFYYMDLWKYVTRIYHGYGCDFGYISVSERNYLLAWLKYGYDKSIIPEIEYNKSHSILIRSITIYTTKDERKFIVTTMALLVKYIRANDNYSYLLYDETLESFCYTIGHSVINRDGNLIIHTIYPNTKQDTLSKLLVWKDEHMANLPMSKVIIKETLYAPYPSHDERY